MRDIAIPYTVVVDEETGEVRINDPEDVVIVQDFSQDLDDDLVRNPGEEDADIVYEYEMSEEDYEDEYDGEFDEYSIHDNPSVLGSDNIFDVDPWGDRKRGRKPTRRKPSGRKPTGRKPTGRKPSRKKPKRPKIEKPKKPRIEKPERPKIHIPIIGFDESVLERSPSGPEYYVNRAIGFNEEYPFFRKYPYGGKIEYKRGKRIGKSTTILGYFYWPSCRININRILEHPFVPDFVRDGVLYHEMCHYVIHLKLIYMELSTATPHGREFKELERQYTNYRKKQRWLKREWGGFAWKMMRKGY